MFHCYYVTVIRSHNRKDAINYYYVPLTVALILLLIYGVRFPETLLGSVNSHFQANVAKY